MKPRFLRGCGRVLYAVAVRLPASDAKPQLGQRALRALCAKMILTSCGVNVNVEKGARFASDVYLGDHAALGRDSYVEQGTVIGNGVMMGPECAVFTRNHVFERTDIPMFQQGATPILPVVIEDDVWIGARVILLPGAHVGKGAVIGAGSVVSGDIPAMAIAAGNPARVLRMRGEVST